MMTLDGRGHKKRKIEIGMFYNTSPFNQRTHLDYARCKLGKEDS